MDRDAIARGRRRSEALEALEFEREREKALHDQIGETVHEQERARIDRDAFARMDPEDAGIVREILGEVEDAPEESWAEDDDWAELLTDIGEHGSPDDDAPSPDEIERLLGEIELSRTRQRALERFLDALEQTGAAEDVGS
jgi:hypothetical protein